ncbi:circularly permuted ATPgrasp domain protein [Leptospira wolffii]|uniref:circularly permuted ATPgrasp domain protein n=1 Tax=Leptospira wolffii TaxID=409998 RepID=UPI001082A83B|nr:circularly permuted ATPgrasp domain protein [Leptospira wolffii]TGK54787.1 circularly permuted ATPgrasp domain protein [Leptospira wolffii]TGK65829.1 circularly permuted ATPgrasp domain protein [Leptospira wolffii]TGK70709.1 circularly permuted ATPgrasp domain protein [Leptospira wolffii]TGL26482.1 circularly permuted ATPgrasp domain protein [Leptospira wolffii]
MNTDVIISNYLNENCSCSTLDKTMIERESTQIDQLSKFYSETPSFISTSELEQIKNVLRALRKVVRLSSVRSKFLKGYSELKRNGSISGGVFMSMDFHLTSKGPKLIEINTNAGGTFLQWKLLQAQIRCCKAVDLALPNETELERLKDKFYSIFIEEWNASERSGVPSFIAIIDDEPSKQFLYPEFVFFKELFLSKGIGCEILSPDQVQLREDCLFFENQMIDLVYNRLTDFHFSDPKYRNIRTAWKAETVVVTPNPMDYDLFANKKNLSTFSDADFLKEEGLDPEDIEILSSSVPKTLSLADEESDEIWNNRKCYFFKPKEGFGSKAAYYGGKLTKNKFQEILSGNYIMQEFVPPSIRTTSLSGKEEELKMDIRAYIYQDEILLLASRLYQGQTTNFRTPGGGFSPLYVLPKLEEILN